MSVDLVGMKLRAEFDGVIAKHFGKAVGYLVGVVGLDQLIGGSAGRIAVEIEVLNALPGGIKRNDAGASVCICETLRRKAHVAASHGLAEVCEIAQIAEVEFID